MFIIPFPVLCKCRNQLNRAKTTKTLSKDDIKEQRQLKKSKDDIKSAKTTLKYQRQHKKSKEKQRSQYKFKDDINIKS